jgi:hypothetical protein
MKSECLEYLQHTGCLPLVSNSFPQLHQHSFNCWYPFLTYVEFVYSSMHHTYQNCHGLYTVGAKFYFLSVYYMRWLPQPANLAYTCL